MKLKINNEKCADVLNHCKIILLDTLQNNGNIFEILDPLVSDNQCQMHSLMLLNILRKCYKIDDYSYDVNRLNSTDIKILSYAVLLSYLKGATIDKFNFVVHEVSLDNFCNYFSTKSAEKRYIASVKVKFNAESVEFIRSLATEDVKSILNECTAVRFYSGNQLQLMPNYSIMFPLFTYLKDHSLPILILFQRLEREMVESDLKYRLHSTEVLLFKLEQGKYRLCDEVNDNDRMQPTIAFKCYSCIGYEPSDENYLSKFGKYIDDSIFPSQVFFQNCDIINLLMMASADYQLPASPSLLLPNGYDNAQTYAEMLYKTNSSRSIRKCYSIHSECSVDSTNIYEQYIGHYNLALACNSSDCTQYCEVVNGAIKRTDRNVFFAIGHVCISNYERECGQQICVKDLLDRTEIYECLDKDKLTIEALKRLGFDISQKS